MTRHFITGYPEHTVINKSINDNINGTKYELVRFNSANQLSLYLKSILKDKKIDYNKFNLGSDVDGLVKNPPKEIYEYQNFFLIENNNKELILLDGFRRLLWYNAPDIPVLVRIYKQSELSDQQILTLLLNLNHFKFFASSHYYERGFALLLNVVFGLNITKYQKVLDAYLHSSKTENAYMDSDPAEGAQKNNVVKERIINKFFVSDLKFIEQMIAAGYMVNKYIGAMIYQYREQFDGEFLIENFNNSIEKYKDVLKPLMDKYNNTEHHRYEKDKENMNLILEIYHNVFKSLIGIEPEKTFAEKMKECKELVEELKKDKNLTKLTGSYNIHKLDQLILDMVKTGKGKEISFKCVIYPNNVDGLLKYGLNEEVKVLKTLVEERYGIKEELVLGIKRDKDVFNISKSFMGNKKYVKIENDNWEKRESHDIDLFVNIPKSAFDQEKQEKEAERLKRKVLFDIKNLSKDGEIFLSKLESGHSITYKCKFIKFEKGSVHGKIVSVYPDWAFHSSDKNKIMTAKITKCYIRGLNTANPEASNWFDKDGTIRK